MANKNFSFREVLGFGWQVMKSNLGFFIGLGFLYLIITNLAAIAQQIIEFLNIPQEFVVISVILLEIFGAIISIVVGIGLIKIALSFCDGIKPPIGTLFNGLDCFWRYLGTGILYGLIVLGGFLLLIIPGIIWSVKYSLCYYFVIDKGLGPLDALKASGRATMGVKWQLFGFGIVCGLIVILGLICLIIGVFAAYPTVLVASALVYRQLMDQTPELAEFGIVCLAAESETETTT